MAAEQLSVACVGLGRIGSGIAQSIQRAGHRLIVFNRTPQKMQPLVALGAKPAQSPRDAAAQAHGFGEWDWSVFTEITRLNAGLDCAEQKVLQKTSTA